MAGTRTSSGVTARSRTMGACSTTRPAIAKTGSEGLRASRGLGDLRSACSCVMRPRATFGARAHAIAGPARPSGARASCVMRLLRAHGDVDVLLAFAAWPAADHVEAAAVTGDPAGVFAGVRVDV